MVQFGNLWVKADDTNLELPIDWHRRFIVPFTPEITAALSLLLQHGVICERDGYNETASLRSKCEKGEKYDLPIVTSNGTNLIRQIKNDELRRLEASLANTNDDKKVAAYEPFAMVGE